MSKFDPSSLLMFLRKPRCLHEITHHFKVPTRLMDFHLHEAIKSGAVLVYGKKIPRGYLNSNAKQLRLKDFLYISKNSPLLGRKSAAANSVPRTGSPTTKESAHHNESLVSSHRKPVFTHNLMTYLRLDETELSGVLNNLSDKMRLAKSDRSIRQLRWKTQYDTYESKSLSYVEKIHLFQALLNQPLPFLDIHRRFDVSKRIVEGFVRRGLFEEVWGPKDIGVKYKLTEKGKGCLERLEKASRFKHQQRRKIFIRLKHRVPS